MNDKSPLTNDEKTVIKHKNITGEVEKTRIAIKYNQDHSSQVLDNSEAKTRIATSSITPNAKLQSEGDETVVNEFNSDTENEKTRIYQKRKNTDQSSKNQDTNSLTPSENSGEEMIIKNRFIIKESLGVGGMGMVFRALDLRKQETGDSNPYLAIKILTNEFKDHPQAFISLQREAQKSQILAHPNIITVFDFDRDGDMVYLTMQELKGQSLDKLINEYPRGVPLEMAIKIIFAINEGLSYAHKKNIVHADLKPENIFYTDDGEVKIIDFGIARILTNLEAKNTTQTQFDPTDELSGLTPAYASLEMLKGMPALPVDDVFAQGIISYELLTGKHPYLREPADIALNNARTFKKISKLKGYQWKAINKALSFHQKDRFLNAGEFRDKFSGKGRLVRHLSVGLLMVSLILAISLMIPREKNMDYLYDELSLVQQTHFNDLIKQGNELLEFDDWNNALSLLDKAHQILPQHSQTKSSLNKAVQKILINIDDSANQLSQLQKKQQVTELLKYSALADNQLLLDYRATLTEG